MAQQHTRHGRLHTPSLILGGLLVAIGFATGRMDSASDAMSQVVTSDKISFLRSGGPMILTTSEDGRTLHIWSAKGGSQSLDPQRTPVYVGQLTAP